jgi:hypothetical protein
MEKNGNIRHKKYYEAQLEADFIRPSHRDHHAFHKFLYDKYVLLRFIPLEAPMATAAVTSDEARALVHGPNTTVFFSNDISSSTSAHDQYKCERDGGEMDRQLDQFIERIGEKRKVIPKVLIGPIERQKEQEKQSLKVKQQFLSEAKRKEEQFARSLSAIHTISHRKKENNIIKAKEMKLIKEQEERDKQELQARRFQDKEQRRNEAAVKRQEKKSELIRRKRHQYYSGFSYGTTALGQIHTFHDLSEDNSMYPPVPRQSLLHKIDKKGLKYSKQREEE